MSDLAIQYASEKAEEPRTMAESVYRRLRTDIIWGELSPGAALRSDELRGSYSVGVSPLREALSRLAAERLVTASGQRGFRVAPLTIEDVRDTMETRLLIEGQALTRSIERGDIFWEKNVAANYHALSRLPIPHRPEATAEVWVKHHRDLHMSLLAACGSSWQFELAGLLFDQADRHRLVTLRLMKQANLARDAAKEHKQIVEAALDRNVSATLKLLDRHYRTTAETLIAAIAKNFQPDGAVDRLSGRVAEGGMKRGSARRHCGR